LIQLLLPVRPAHLINLARHAAHDLDPQFAGIVLQIRTQGATNQGFDPLLLEQFQALVGLQMRHLDLFPRSLISWVIRKYMNARAPIQHWGNPGPQHRDGKHDVLLAKHRGLCQPPTKGEPSYELTNRLPELQADIVPNCFSIIFALLIHRMGNIGCTLHPAQMEKEAVLTH
jgi:hypothetical protein